VARLAGLVDQKMTELRETVDLRRKQGATPAMEVVLSDRGKRIMDELRDICFDVRREAVSRQNEV
jgi:CHASE3 domain sensor protein